MGSTAVSTPLTKRHVSAANGNLSPATSDAISYADEDISYFDSSDAYATVLSQGSSYQNWRAPVRCRVSGNATLTADLASFVPQILLACGAGYSDTLAGQFYNSAPLLRVQARLAQLEQLAEEEGVTVNADSRSDLLAFLNDLSSGKVPAIFLLESGSLRCVWRTEDREQVGIEFLGNRAIRYVLLANRGERAQSRSVGLDDVDHILQQVTAMGLAHLIQ